MIVGNSTWETDLAAAQKKALYYLVIDEANVFVLSFVPGSESVGLAGGYGYSYGTAYGEQ